MSQPEFEILKRDDDKRLVFGFASVAVNVDGSLLTDSQGDQIEPAELERAAYDYVLKSREGAAMHSKRDVARIVESFVVTPEKLAKMGLAVDAVPCGWWIGMKISDEDTWSRVQKGELRAFSIGGKARRESVELVEKGDLPGHEFRGNQWTSGEGSGEPNSESDGNSEQSEIAQRISSVSAELEREYASLYESKDGTSFGDRTYSWGQQEKIKALQRELTKLTRSLASTNKPKGRKSIGGNA